MYITGRKKLKDKICKATNQLHQSYIRYQRKQSYNKLLNGQSMEINK